MKSLLIKNYKNIQNLTINSLADVNLIVGRNNVGKSTLLEAISFFASNGDINWIKQILEFRGESVNFRLNEENAAEKELDRFLTLFTGRKIDFSDNKPIIIGEDDKNFISMRIVRFEENIIKDENGNERKTRTVIQDKEDYTKFESIYSGIEIETLSRKILIPLIGNRYSSSSFPSEKKIDFEYVKTSDFRNEKNANLWDRISLFEEESYVIEALRIIEPRIAKINFLKEDNNSRNRNEEERVPFVTLNNDDKRYRLSSMGVGVNRILTIILSLVNCKNGILLLDEFENGLHYSVQTDLWKIIFMLSKKLNLQIFVTSHSNDCINSFSEASLENRGKLIRLENLNGKISEVSYDDKDDIKFSINQNIEIR